MRRCLITGGAGFIGSHIVDAFSSAGYSILVVDNFSTGSVANLSSALENRSVEFLELDICESTIVEVMRDFRPELVLHFAAQANVRRSVAEPDFDADVNIVATVRLLEEANRLGGVGVVFASTGGAIYGEQNRFPADESHSADPKSQYGVSKRCAELYLEFYAQHLKVPSIALRFANVYGPRQNPKGEAGVVAIFIDSLIAGRDLKVNGSGEQTRDFVYVSDVVSAVLKSAEALGRIEKFACFNVGTGIESSVNQLASILSELWVRRGLSSPKIVYGPPAAGEQMRSVVDSKKLSTELGWKLSTSLQVGLQQTLESFCQKRES